MDEHVAEAFLASGGEAVIAARGSGGRWDLADGDEFFIGEAGENWIKRGLREGEAVEKGEALEKLVAVDLLLTQGDEDKQLDEAFSELGDPSGVGAFGWVWHGTS
jgi:hypothetical protein